MVEWKLRTNCVFSLVVIVIVILVRFDRTSGEKPTENPRKLVQLWTSKNLTNELGNGTFHAYFAYWNGTLDDDLSVDEDYVKNMTVNEEEYPDAEDEFEDAQLYNNDINGFYGESISDTLFHSSTNNMSLIFTDLSKCLYDYNLVTCLKMLLLNRVNNMLYLIEKNNLTQTDFYLLNGYIAFKLKNETQEPEEKVDEDVKEEENKDEEDDERYLTIDQELSEKIHLLFKNRTLRISLLPGFGIDISPLPKKKGQEFVCFSTRTFLETPFNKSGMIK